MEAIDEGDGCFLGDFWLDMLAHGRGSEYAQVLSLGSAVLVGLDGRDQQVVPEWGQGILLVDCS
jgi:hypothetical protein